MKTKNIIIGAGPAGLAMAGRFSKAGLPFEILEQSDKIAVKWHEHYDRLCLHTVKQLSALPFMPLPESLPIYVPKQDLVSYYENYAEHFQIKPLFNTKVLSLDKKTEFWEIKTQNGKTFEAENVIVATGINRIPKIPTWSGQENFKGQIIHASQYKNPEKFKGKRVLVVGMGNTGAEIALDLAEHQVSVGISIRSEVVVVPRDLFGRPVQLTAKLLAKLPNFLGDKIAKMSSWIAFGNLKKLGLPISDKAPTAFRRETGRTPTIDLGTVSKIKSGAIKIYPDIASLNDGSIQFKNNISESFDALILATGYYGHVNDFIHADSGVFNELGEPNGIAPAKGLYFIGFEKYDLNGTLGTLKQESEQIFEEILIK